MTTKEELRFRAIALFPYLPCDYYWACELLITLLRDLNDWRIGKSSVVPDNAWVRWLGVRPKAKLELVEKQ